MDVVNYLWSEAHLIKRLFRLSFILRRSAVRRSSLTRPTSSTTALPTFADARNQFELNYLRKLLQITKGNVTHAARMAGRNRTEFYKLLSRHELDANDFKE